MVYEAYKKMLEKTPEMTAKMSDRDMQEMVRKAERFLSYISLRRYMQLDLEELIGDTFAAENPLVYTDVDKQDLWDRTAAANEEMRKEHGRFSEEFDDPLKELVSWCALFPEQRKMLLDLTFPHDEASMVPQGAVIVFSHMFGCSIGDELPLPRMIAVLNAVFFLELVQNGEEELAKRLIEREKQKN